MQDTDIECCYQETLTSKVVRVILYILHGWRWLWTINFWDNLFCHHWGKMVRQLSTKCPLRQYMPLITKGPVYTLTWYWITTDISLVCNLLHSGCKKWAGWQNNENNLMTVTFTTCVVKEIANILDIFLLEAFYSFGFAKHILCMPSNSWVLSLLR